MNEERKMILQMLKDGEISVDEAERLIDAVSKESADAESSGPDNESIPKRISIKITEGEKSKLNLKVPFSLLRTALKLGKTAGFIGVVGSKGLQGDISEEIMATIKAIDPEEILNSLGEGAISLPHTIVDMNDDTGQNVIILLE